MRGFGDSETHPARRHAGPADWVADVPALVRALGIEAPVHLVGRSTGGAAIARHALDRPVASLAFIAEDTFVADLTGLLDRDIWHTKIPRLRVIVRDEPLHPATASGPPSGRSSSGATTS